MWTSKLFWKVFAALGGLLVVAGILFGVLVARVHEAELQSQLVERLRVAAVLLGRLATDPFEDEGRDQLPHRLHEQIAGLARETGMRFTYLALDGHVVADSDVSDVSRIATMENHRDRPEIQQALDDGLGVTRRFSETLKQQSLYVAVRVDRLNKPVGLARAAVLVEKTDQKVRQGRFLVVVFTSLVIGVALVALCYLLARIINPLLKLIQAVDRMAHGELHQKIDVRQQDELGLLVRAFNRMNDELVSHIDQLRARGDQLATVLGGMVEGVIALDQKQHVLFANTSAGRLFSFLPDTAQGRPLSALIRDESVHRSVRDAMASRQPVNLELTRFRPNYETLTLHASPLPGTPCPGVVLVLYDLTRLRRLETLRQEFVANVSHELKTPLSAIKAYAETLLAGALADSEYNRVFVQRIEDQADRLHQLILDMLSLARIESGREAYQVSDIELEDVVSDSIERHRDAAMAKSLELESVAPAESVVVRADEEAVQQILDNLLSNAIKYTPQGGAVTVRWGSEGPYAKLEVADTGIGIDPEHHERLFERFYRVDKARSRELGGTGLGLSIVKHLAQFFGGAVGVQSEVGKGSVFWVKLPLKR